MLRAVLVAWTMIHLGCAHRGEVGTTIIADRQARIVHEGIRVSAHSGSS
jgi:hypothetical protein